MNLEPFFRAYQVISENETEIPQFPEWVSDDDDFREFITSYGGKSFNQGIYRVIKASHLSEIREKMEKIFPELTGQLMPFGYDWMGRFFAVDLKPEGDSPEILMLEIGTGDSYIIPGTIETFHNNDLVNHPNESLALKLWKKWQKTAPAPLENWQCVGNKIPLFLGGYDKISNLEVSDLAVYLEICGQLLEKTRHLPEGTPVNFSLQ